MIPRGDDPDVRWEIRILNRADVVNELNQRSWDLVQTIQSHGSTLNIAESRSTDGTRLLDFGVDRPGGLQAGLELARVTMADLANVQLMATDSNRPVDCQIAVSTDRPLQACMGAQYAGWPVQTDSYFAMGSGAMRAKRGKEKILIDCSLVESADRVVGVLESSQLPDDETCRLIASECSLAADRITLLVAPVTSIAGTIQVVARSVETALHKMFELGFDLSRIRSAFGTAPLPPCAENDIQGIGRTNDAILYGGAVTLWMTGDDKQLTESGRLIPSCASSAYGEPFAEIFRRHDGDFYKIDPMLFSPARVRLVNLTTGKQFEFGSIRPDIVRKSFGVESNSSQQVDD